MINCLRTFFFPLSFQILDVLCSLCVCNGVAVRTNQNLICDNLLPNRDLLLQTRLVNDVQRYEATELCNFILVCFLFPPAIFFTFISLLLPAA